MKPLTQADYVMTVENALDRAALIAAQDADAPKLTQRLDAEAMRVLVEYVKALRAALADERKHADTLAGGLTNAYIECRIYDGTPEFDSLAQQIHANMAVHAARRTKEAGK